MVLIFLHVDFVPRHDVVDDVIYLTPKLVILANIFGKSARFKWQKYQKVILFRPSGGPYCKWGELGVHIYRSPRAKIIKCKVAESAITPCYFYLIIVSLAEGALVLALLPPHFLPSSFDQRTHLSSTITMAALPSTGVGPLPPPFLSVR